MVFINSSQLNIKIDEYQKHNLPIEQHFGETSYDTIQAPSVSIDTKDIFPLKFYDALSYIKEVSDDKIQTAEALSPVMESTHSVALWGNLIDADSSQFQGYDDVPSGHFQIYAPLTISDNQLKDLVHSLAKEGKLLGGSQALFKALDHDTARIYNQSAMENFTGRPVDWKKGYMFGTMWDRRVIDEKLIQQFEQEGKQIFTGAIGSIHFSIVY
ncbi:hypothetical protein [Bartonella schoenbuchensis]|uniref:Uncharacterized protein n=1 Tax=Bartonella schoenbuchensis m07a TaxID=1094496 RepID=N6UH41_9HYPH|nr:hypothetical protein [Bartonella schoenbuchensis]ENN91829.1 hypothetical protein m07a_07150 [Bartonella schoenbuchensis m07a]